ncbi:MAG: tetratricopeptide repeat protein [Alphaproteobacteria bacterium]|nr:tetratricopeptide repeat protein [Alphaproteobacteria bacterium]
MKKKTTKKTQVKATAARGVNIKTAARTRETSSWSISIYVYWFIILFFIAATFYILGRSHLMNKEVKSVLNNAGQIEMVDTQNNEEKLMNAADYYTRGKSEILAGNIDGAVADLNAAIQADATMVDAYILRGEVYMQTGNYSAAMNDFNNAIAIDASNSIAYYDRALLNMRLEDFNSAMNDINNALATYASNPNEILQLRDLYAKRGQLNLWMKNWEGAIADYTNSLARPEGIVNPSVYAERAEAYTAMGEYALAINDYTSAIRVISEQIQGVTTMEQKEDLSMRAMNYFEKSAALNLNIGNAASAKTDLESAYAIAASLNDADTTERLQKLIEALQ